MFATREGTARALVRAAGVRTGSAPPAFAGLALEEAAEAILWEKVGSRILKVLTESGDPLAERLYEHPRFATVRARGDVLTHAGGTVLGTVDGIARDLGIPVWGIKGLAARRMYPDPELRDLGDLDLMAASFEDAIRLAGRLRPEGYGFNRREFPWIKQADGRIYGQFSLVPRDRARYPTIDLHFGAYSVRHCARHPLRDVDTTPGLSYLTAQQNLPMMVGNAAGDHRITTKDLNDLAVALEHGDVDWARVRADLDAVCLTRFFALMVDAFMATPLGGTPGADRLTALVRGVPRERPGTAARWSDQRRIAATVVHAYAHGRRTSFGRAMVTSVTAARYYARPLRLRVTADAAAGRFPRISAWTCVRLVPVELLRRALADDDAVPRSEPFLDLDGAGPVLTDSCRVVSDPRGDIVRMPFGDLLPTVFYRLPRALVDLVR